MKQQKRPSEVPPRKTPEIKPNEPDKPALPNREPEIIPEQDPKPSKEPNVIPQPAKK